MNNSKPTILRSLQEILAAALQDKPEHMNPQLSFLEMGADSIVLMEALQKIEKQYQVKIAMHLVFEELNTLSRLADFISANSKHKEPAVAEQDIVAYKEPVVLAPMRNGMDSRPDEERRHGPNLERIITQQMELLSEQLRLLHKAYPDRANDTQAIKPQVVYPEKKQAADIASFSPVKLKEDRILTAQQQQAFLDRFIESYNAKTAKSKIYAQANRAVLTDSDQCFRLQDGLEGNPLSYCFFRIGRLWLHRYRWQPLCRYCHGLWRQLFRQQSRIYYSRN